MLVPAFAARFQILERAARGGTSEVVRAFDRILGRQVALKIIGDDTADSAFVRREIDLLARLAHPGIVAYFDEGVTDEGRPYVVTEWLEGETLQARLARAPLRLDESLSVVSGVASALAHAHARGITHRDVKPSNVVLLHGDPRVPKLIDFGIAHPEYVPLTTGSGGLVGTPGYLAPEQARGEAVDARADVFSLGAVLYECIVGAPVFGRGSAVVVLARLLLDDVPRLREVHPEVGVELDALVHSMLSRDPDRRPRDARAVLQKLAARKANAASVAKQATRRTGEMATNEHRYCIIVAGAPRFAEAPPVPVSAAKTIDDRIADDHAAPSAERTRSGAIPSRSLAAIAETFGFRTLASGRAPLLALKRLGTDAGHDAREAVLCAQALSSHDGALAIVVAIGAGAVDRASCVHGEENEGDVLARALSVLRASDAGVHMDASTAPFLEASFRYGGI